MKRVRFTTVLLTIALSLTISAQKTYLPMLEEGRKWNLVWLHPWDASGEYREGYYEIGPGLWYKGSEEQLSIQGDTVFDGRIYKRMVKSDINGRTYGFFRQEDGKIYRKWSEGDSDELVFDFELKEGDILNNESWDNKTIKVLKVDTICVNGVYRKRLKLDNADCWIEGVGCKGGPHDSQWMQVIGSYPKMLSCYQGDHLIFDNNDFNAPGITETQEEELSPDDYKPFVEIPEWSSEPLFVRSWNVVHTQYGENPDFNDYSAWLSDNYSFDYYELKTDRLVIKDKVYYLVDVKSRSHSQKKVWVREDNRKVYVYSETDKKEYLLYDFTLKEGDTCAFYDIETGEELNLKVLKEGVMTEATWIYPRNTMLNYETMVEQKRPLRTWVMGILSDADVYPQEYQELFTMIEGIGCNEGPFFHFDKKNGYDYLAFAIGPERDILTDRSHSVFASDDVSFPVYNTRFATVHGFDMKTGEKSDNEPTDWPIRHELNFELENGQLHGYGFAYTACEATNYAFFIETPTENPFVHLLHLKIDMSSFNYADCTGWHQTDFYVPGFGVGDIKNAPEGYDPSKIDYIVVDEYGNEYPVVKKQSQATVYRPFIEENKVWKVGVTDYLDWSIDNPVEMIECFYFEGDTIVDGKVCKRMMEQIYPIGNNSDYNPNAFLTYVGAWYENDHKVYFAAPNKPLRLMYDFSVSEGDTVCMDGIEFTFVKTVGDIKGFKGVCYKLHVPTVKVYILGMETLLLNVWLEGVGSATRPDINMDRDFVYLNKNLLSCSVGDEIIYLNDKYDDSIPLDPETPKRRIDFTHTVKVKPKAPVRMTNEETEESLIGEYNVHQLCIRLGALQDAFIVTIKDQNDSVVYHRYVHTNEIVALNIDISDYTEGDYSVCIENDKEAFNGKFIIEPTAIHDVMSEQKAQDDNRNNSAVYDLTGRRLSYNQLQNMGKGIYLINGKKMLVR